MVKLVKHKFVSAIPDGTDATIVRPSNWNDDHDLTGIAESGANTDITSMSGITGTIGTPTAIQMDDGNSQTLVAGKLWYTPNTGAWNAGMGNGNITQQIGEELFVYGKASSAITDSPLQIVYHTGTVGASGVITFAPTIAGITDENAIIGVATESLALNAFGRITTFGVVRGITTNGTAFGETWADDDVIWYNPVTGNPTKVKPSAPNIKFQIGTVIKAGSGGSGSFQVNLVQGTALGGTDSNVKLTSLANNQLLQYDSTAGYWKNVNASAVSTGAGGSDTQIQYNNAGILGGVSPLTYNGTTLAMSSGTINNASIGATTPSTGNFTTITGQTEVLKGTGSNLFLCSEQFDNAYWSKTGATVTANSTTAPDGNVTADSLIENTANSEHGINNNSSTTIVANTIYIVSCYVKANGRTKGTIKYVLNSFATQIGADFDLTAGTISSAYIALGSGATNLVSSISNVGNGWFRVSVGGILDSTSTTVRGQILLSNGTSTTYTGNGTSGFYIWGCQFEIGSTANTYVPTTTTAVYGTPSLSFSGVAGIGLESNGALYVSPAGTGAIQAQATTSTATGGNARGANAVDWQTARSAATQVAQGQYSVVGGVGAKADTSVTFSQAHLGVIQTQKYRSSNCLGNLSNYTTGNNISQTGPVDIVNPGSGGTGVVVNV